MKESINKLKRIIMGKEVLIILVILTLILVIRYLYILNNPVNIDDVRYFLIKDEHSYIWLF